MPKRSSAAILRTEVRTVTTSSEVRTARVSDLRTSIRRLLRYLHFDFLSGTGDIVAKNLHAAFDAESGPNTRQRHTKLNKCDGDCRAHTDDYRLRVKHARHRRDVAKHSTDERVNDLQR